MNEILEWISSHPNKNDEEKTRLEGIIRRVALGEFSRREQMEYRDHLLETDVLATNRAGPLIIRATDDLNKSIDAPRRFQNNIIAIEKKKLDIATSTLREILPELNVVKRDDLHAFCEAYYNRWGFRHKPYSKFAKILER